MCRFCSLVFEPLKLLFAATSEGDKALWTSFVEKHKIKLPKEATEFEGNNLFKVIMQNWLPAAPALLEMMITHLPSPAEAQRYRVQNLYSGPMDDEAALAIRNCDPEGPLVMYVSKMVCVTRSLCVCCQGSNIRQEPLFRLRACVLRAGECRSFCEDSRT